MEQSDLLRYALDVMEEMDVSYAVVGSFASGAYGEPRFTQDIDIVVDLRTEHVAELCRRFPDPEYYVSQQAVRDAVIRRRQFNVIHPASGNKIDFMMSRNDAWGRSQLARRQKVQMFTDRSGYFASPEDVILGKMVYYREGGSEKHLRDITGILTVQADRVDYDYIAQFAEQLAVTEVWGAVLRRMKSKNDLGGKE